MDKLNFTKCYMSLINVVNDCINTYSTINEDIQDLNWVKSFKVFYETSVTKYVKEYKEIIEENRKNTKKEKKFFPGIRQSIISLFMLYKEELFSTFSIDSNGKKSLNIRWLKFSNENSPIDYESNIDLSLMKEFDEIRGIKLLIVEKEKTQDGIEISLPISEIIEFICFLISKNKENSRYLNSFFYYFFGSIYYSGIEDSNIEYFIDACLILEKNVNIENSALKQKISESTTVIRNVIKNNPKMKQIINDVNRNMNAISNESVISVTNLIRDSLLDTSRTTGFDTVLGGLKKNLNVSDDILSSEQTDEYRKVYEIMDSKGSGYLSNSELDELLNIAPEKK